ncbi:MAG: hypothetical protein JF620_00385, partial [Mesorhizobium sp.]|nr:hypothetical protein [Mesorhizobium sp.]
MENRGPIGALALDKAGKLLATGAETCSILLTGKALIWIAVSLPYLSVTTGPVLRGTAMFFSLIAIAAVIALFVIVSRLQKRIALVERELTTLQGLVAAGAVQPASSTVEGARQTAREPAKLAPAAAAALPEDESVAKPEAAEGEVAA